MAIFYWVIAILLCGLGALVIVGNWLILFRWLRNRKDRTSYVPLIGGLFALIGLAWMPVEGISPWGFLTLVLDPGCLPLLMAGGARGITQLFK